MRKKTLKKGIVMMTALLSAAGILFGMHAQAVYATKIADETTNAQDDNAGVVLSSNARLKSLNITPGTMTPEFSPEVTKYTIDVAEDVEMISVTCSVEEATSKVIEAGGFKGLEMGSNQAILTVQAADGSKCTYNLTINRGAATTAGTEVSEQEGNVEEGTTEADNAEVGIMPISADLDTIPVGGDTIYSSFLVNATFADELLPEGFVKETYNYKGVTVDSAYFAAGDVRLLYLSTGDKTSQDFRLYYEDTDTFMDLLQLKGTDGKFIMPVRYQGQIKIPDNYTGSYLPFDDKVVSCYIYTELTDKPLTTTGQEDQKANGGVMNQAGASLEEEPVNVSDLDVEVEFYLIYAMNNEGTEGFYLYDIVEGTYQRYVERDTSYELDQSYFKYKDIAHQRFAIMCVLIALLVVAVFCIINLILKNKELKSDLGDDDGDDDGSDDDDHNGGSSDDGSDDGGDGDGAAANVEKEETLPEAAPHNEADFEEEIVSQEIDEGSLEEKIISQIEVEDKQPEEAPKKQEVPKQEEPRPVRTNPVRKPSNFKMINLSREPEPSGLDDDFEFEFINLDDD